MISRPESKPIPIPGGVERKRHTSRGPANLFPAKKDKKSPPPLIFPMSFFPPLTSEQTNTKADTKEQTNTKADTKASYSSKPGKST